MEKVQDKINAIKSKNNNKNWVLGQKYKPFFFCTSFVVCIIYVYTCVYVCMCRVKVPTGAGRVHQMRWSGSSPVLGHELGFSREQLLKAKANPGPSLRFRYLEKKHSPSPKTRTTFGKASNGLWPRPWLSQGGFGSWEPTASPLKGCGYQSQSHRILVLCILFPYTIVWLASCWLLPIVW